MVSLATTRDGAQTDIDLIVSAVAVPVLVADYSALIERFAGIPGAEVEDLFRRDSTALMECLPLARAVAASPEWIRLYGSPLADRAPDLIGRKFTPEDYPELHESLIRQFTAPMKGIDSVVSEHTAPTMTGDVIVRSHWKASKIDGQTAYQRVVVVDLDVTHLRRTQRYLEETLESKDRFIATVGHELRNPMTSLMGFGSLLHTEWDLLDDTARREMVSIIAHQSRDVAELLDDLLTSAVGDTLRVANERVQLGQMLSSLDLSGLDSDLDPELTFVGDQLRARQILRNLRQNADRHGGKRHRVTADRVGEEIRIHVSDDGDGVPDSVASRLFEPYSHGGGEGSVGLGLSVSRMLAEAMGGSLEYHRRDGWTTFTLTLRSA